MLCLKKALGFTLIEVLVAMGILSLGILGAASLQAKAMGYMQMAASQVSAAQLSRDLVGRMRANSSDPAILAIYGHEDGHENGHESGGDTPEPQRNCAAQACSGEQLAAYDLSQWLGKVKHRWKLASSTLLAMGEPEPSFILRIRWGAQSKNKGDCRSSARGFGDSGCWQTRAIF